MDIFRQAFSILANGVGPCATCRKELRYDLFISFAWVAVAGDAAELIRKRLKEANDEVKARRAHHDCHSLQYCCR